MKFFAFDEKMFSPQLHAIIPGAIPLGSAKIVGYKLFFHCKSHNDPSGKCNIIPIKDPDAEVWGVLYEITPTDLPLLEKSEMVGYGIQEITVKVISKEQSTFAFTYIAHKESIFEDLVPYSWYKDLMIEGAREHHLPVDYIHHLEQVACAIDPNPHRANKQRRFLESLHL